MEKRLSGLMRPEFSSTETGKLDSVEDKMNGVKCSEIHPPIKPCSCLCWWLAYRQDSDRKHIVKPTQIVLEWLKTKNLNVLQWTSQSPGLNLIKNM